MVIVTRLIPSIMSVMRQAMKAHDRRGAVARGGNRLALLAGEGGGGKEGVGKREQSAGRLIGRTGGAQQGKMRRDLRVGRDASGGWTPTPTTAPSCYARQVG